MRTETRRLESRSSRSDCMHTSSTLRLSESTDGLLYRLEEPGSAQTGKPCDCMLVALKQKMHTEIVEGH
eukprot:IDg1989t1